MKWWGNVGLLFVLGCGPSVGSDDAGGGDASDSDDTTTSTSTSTSTSTVTTAQPLTTLMPDTTVGEECMSGPVDGELECVPRGDSVAAFSMPVFDAQFGTDFRSPCTIVSDEDVDESTQRLEFDCENWERADPVELFLTSAQPRLRFFAFDETVTLHYVSILELEANPCRYLTIEDTNGNVIFAAIDGAELPDRTIIDFGWIDLALPSSRCDAFQTECLYVQRSGLEVTWVDMTGTVFGGNSLTLGAFSSLTVVADEVERQQCWPDECGINYYDWSIRALFYFIPEG